MITDREARELVEEAIENGYIDCDNFGVVCLFYREFVIWSFFRPWIDIYWDRYGYEKFIYSEELHKKLKLMFKVWETI